MSTFSDSFWGRVQGVVATFLEPAVDYYLNPIRAQLVNRRTGALEMDFVVLGAEHNAPAFAEHVVAGIQADALGESARSALRLRPVI